MKVVPKITASPTAIAWALFSFALLWYWSFWVTFSSGGNYLSHVSWPWFLVSAFVPVISLALAFAMHRALRDSDRSIRFHEILIVIVVVPQFLGGAYGWWGLLYYMGVL